MKKFILQILIATFFITSCKVVNIEKQALSTYTYKDIKLNYSKNISLNELKPTIERLDRALQYYTELSPSNTSFKITVNILTKADWENVTDVQPYGMPHANPMNNTLTMAYEDNDFWRSTIPNEKVISKEQMDMFKKTYSDKNGNIKMKSFFDLLAIHELGHLLENNSGLDLHKSWLKEFYANYFLHGYIATKEPENLDKLVLSPAINLELLKGGKYKTLNEFEENYGGGMSGLNYAWYQSKLHVMANHIYSKTKDKGLINLFEKFKNDTKTFKTNDDLINYIEKEIGIEMATSFKNF